METEQFSLDEVRTLLELAEAAARQAGSLLRDKWSRPRHVQRKGYRDLVTDADLASQALITGLVRDRFPEHGFLAEESDESLPATGPLVWVIDPVDGTTNYSRQQPNYCVSIAAMTPGGRVLAGVIYDPVHDDLYSAALGQGARRNNQTIAVSQVGDLEDAVIGFDWSRSSASHRALLASLGTIAPQAHTIRGIGSAALALAWIAVGRLDGYFNYGLKAWDAAAGQLLISEAGGVLTMPAGTPWRPAASGCLAGNQDIHRRLLPLLRLPTP